MLGSSLKFEADVLDEATLERLLRAFDRRHHEHLESLRVSMNQVTDEQGELIANAITLARFNTLSVSLKGLSDSCQRIILFSIIANEDLTDVDVAFDLLNLASKEAISAYIGEKHSSVVVSETAELVHRLGALSILNDEGVEESDSEESDSEYDLVADVASDITNLYRNIRGSVSSYLPEMPNLSNVTSAFAACSPKYKPD
jgi:hypothetical protein